LRTTAFKNFSANGNEVITLFKKTMKLVLLVIAGIIGIIWFIVAVGLGFFGLLGFLASSSQKGFRETLYVKRHLPVADGSCFLFHS
jgi:hypothetical protein